MLGHHKLDRLSLFIHCIVYCIGTLWFCYQSQTTILSIIRHSGTQFTWTEWIAANRQLNWTHHMHEFPFWRCFEMSEWCLYLCFSCRFPIKLNETTELHGSQRSRLILFLLMQLLFIVRIIGYSFLFEFDLLDSLHLFLFFLFCQTLLQCNLIWKQEFRNEPTFVWCIYDEFVW